MDKVGLQTRKGLRKKNVAGFSFHYYYYKYNTST